VQIYFMRMKETKNDTVWFKNLEGKSERETRSSVTQRELNTQESKQAARDPTGEWSVKQ